MKIAGVSAAWDRPKETPRAVLVLAHGAGGDLDDELLHAVGKGLVNAGVATLRFNFPYREAGRRVPGSQSQSEDCYREVASIAREESVPLLCGGKSYGGRMATHIVSDGFDVGGLVLFSYPLHAPGRPDKLRDAHLKTIRQPMLFVQGTRDPFATEGLLDKSVASLHDAKLVPIDGGDHSLKVSGRTRADVVAQVVGTTKDFVDRLTG